MKRFHYIFLHLFKHPASIKANATKQPLLLPLPLPLPLLLSLLLTFLLPLSLFSQSQGLSYQAVILDQDPQEVPGVDVTGNILPNHELMVRFSILDSMGTIDYQEEQQTTTDAYGMINLIIGEGISTPSSPGVFKDIDWSGSPKSLKVDISFSTAEVFYTDFSLQELTFVPYAFHKNITATGTLDVNGSSTLRNRVTVTDGSPTFLTGNLKVDEYTTLEKDLTVNAPSSLKGQVTINTETTGDKSSMDAYPLRVQGSSQGVAVKINGSRSSSNNFVAFWDDENLQGRIEGQTTSELLTDPEYIFDNIIFANEILRSTVDVAKAVAGIASASTSSTVCAGLGACVTAPVPSLIAGAIAEAAMEAANLALSVAQPVLYNVSKLSSIGVTYQSGAGDYAEWLLKTNPEEKFYPGEIVGVNGGKISKITTGAANYMVISLNPIVLGNMPETGKEQDYEKVAFMGQVPVKVLGKVNVGDYILPSGNHNGSGIAVSPENMQPHQYREIVGMAWSASESDEYSYVNVAVGLQANSIAQLSLQQEKKIREQADEISSLKSQLDKMNAVLTQLMPEYAKMMEEDKTLAVAVAEEEETVAGEEIKVVNVNTPEQGLEEGQRTVVYFEVTREQILEGIALAEQTLISKGVDISKNPFFVKMKTEAGYQENFINDLQKAINKELDAQQEKDAKSGARVLRF
jgi:hypothetical protein